MTCIRASNHQKSAIYIKSFSECIFCGYVVLLHQVATGRNSRTDCLNFLVFCISNHLTDAGYLPRASLSDFNSRYSFKYFKYLASGGMRMFVIWVNIV